MSNLKEEIKQKRFETPQQEATINLIFTHAWVTSKMKYVLRPHKVSHQQYNVLRILRGAHPEKVSSGYIKERMLDKESNITRLIDKLVDKKYVIRNLCPENRRKMDIIITKTGLSELKILDAEIKKADNVFEKLTNEEAVELNRILNKVRS